MIKVVKLTELTGVFSVSKMVFVISLNKALISKLGSLYLLEAKTILYWYQGTDILWFVIYLEYMGTIGSIQ